MDSKEFLKLLDSFTDKVNVMKTSKTFLEIIDYAQYENYLSRILAYCMTTDMDFVIRLILFLGGKVSFKSIKPQKVVCEKYMFGKRADVFAEYQTDEGRVTITVENKIETWEHKTIEVEEKIEYQTDTYARWVKENYKNDNDRNFFIYLKPDFNLSLPHSVKFVTVVYSKLANMLHSNDYIVIDFKKHINRYLGGNDMGNGTRLEYTREQTDLIAKYSDIKKMYDKVSKYIVEIQNAVFSVLDKKTEEGFSEYKVEKAESEFVTSYRYYKGDKWYKADKYYCYLEILFDANSNKNILTEIRFQEIVKTYNKSEYKRPIQSLSCAKLYGNNVVIRKMEDFYVDEETTIGGEKWVQSLCDGFLRFVRENEDDIERLIANNFVEKEG